MCLLSLHLTNNTYILIISAASQVPVSKLQVPVLAKGVLKKRFLVSILKALEWTTCRTQYSPRVL